MRNMILATGAALLALTAASIAPASAGGYGHGHHGYYYSHGYHYSDIYQDPPPVGVVYKHYLPDEDDFGYLPRRHYAPRYVSRHYYPAKTYRYHKRKHYSRYDDSRYDSRDSDDCDWLYRRAKRSDSRYWWNRYERCED